MTKLQFIHIRTTLNMANNEQRHSVKMIQQEAHMSLK